MEQNLNQNIKENKNDELTDTLITIMDSGKKVTKIIYNYLKPDLSNIMAKPSSEMINNNLSIAQLRAKQNQSIEGEEVLGKCTRPNRDSLPPLIKNSTDKQICQFLGGNYLDDGIDIKCIPKKECSGQDLRHNILLDKTLVGDEMSAKFNEYKLIGVPTHAGIDKETVKLHHADFILDCIYSPEHESGIATFKDEGKLKCLYRPLDSLDLYKVKQTPL